jgi:hypothetical protein
MANESRQLAELIAKHRADVARTADPEPAEVGFLSAITALAHLEIGNAEPESAARKAAAALGVSKLHAHPRSLALPAEKRIELMLLQRLRAHVEGN